MEKFIFISTALLIAWEFLHQNRYLESDVVSTAIQHMEASKNQW